MRDFVIFVLILMALYLLLGMLFGSWYLIEICLETREARKIRHDQLLEEHERMADQETRGKVTKEKKIKPEETITNL